MLYLAIDVGLERLIEFSILVEPVALFHGIVEGSAIRSIPQSIYKQGNKKNYSSHKHTLIIIGKKAKRSRG
jgi:hypothetical protein